MLYMDKVLLGFLAVVLALLAVLGGVQKFVWHTDSWQVSAFFGGVVAIFIFLVFLQARRDGENREYEVEEDAEDIENDGDEDDEDEVA
jgi:low affinity Fe/Cu permease